MSFEFFLCQSEGFLWKGIPLGKCAIFFSKYGPKGPRDSFGGSLRELFLSKCAFFLPKYAFFFLPRRDSFGKVWTFFTEVRCFFLQVCMFSTKVRVFFLAPKGSLWESMDFFYRSAQFFFFKYACFLLKCAVFFSKYSPKGIPSGTFFVRVCSFFSEYGVFLSKCAVFFLKYGFLSMSVQFFNTDFLIPNSPDLPARLGRVCRPGGIP